MGITRASPFAWVESSASRLGVLSSSTMASGLFVASWLVLTYVATRWRWASIGESSGSSWKKTSKS